MRMDLVRPILNPANPYIEIMYTATGKREHMREKGGIVNHDKDVCGTGQVGKQGAESWEVHTGDGQIGFGGCGVLGVRRRSMLTGRNGCVVKVIIRYRV